MITLEIIEQLTPERIKAMSLEEKREALAILEALEIPRLERIKRPGVDHLLGVPIPEEPAIPTQQEPAVQQPAEQEPKPEPTPAVPRILTRAEWAKQESERVQAEAEEFQQTDFLTKLCGIGSTKPSGKGNRRWDA